VRVVDLDRDMSDVIPTGVTRDSAFLFEHMTRRSLALLEAAAGRRILDVACGVGQDSAALAARGAAVVGVEPSARMTGMGRLYAADHETPLPGWVRGWSDALPFADASFDATLCKGAIDHFDRPDEAIGEMARVTRSDGRVVLAIANFDSLSCRASRALDAFRERTLGRPPARGRRGYDAPSDHFTRYELDLMREHASRHLELDWVEGVSLGWGLPAWSRLATRMPERAASLSLQALDWLARRAPAWADVILLAGRPRRAAGSARRRRLSSSTSA
jgi:SAM-dependent methyltransferase